MRVPIEPSVYVIAGPNGAGKTTFASEFLPRFVECKEFLNADLIAAGLSPFAPESQKFRAGSLLLQRFTELASEETDFAFETTLAGLIYASRLGELQRKGYRVKLFFLWLPSAEMAVARVANRVKQGGHHVPEVDIVRRYTAGLRNLFQLYRPLVDAWWLIDASQLPPKVVSIETLDKLTMVQRSLFRTIAKQAEATYA